MHAHTQTHTHTHTNTERHTLLVVVSPPPPPPPCFAIHLEQVRSQGPARCQCFVPQVPYSCAQRRASTSGLGSDDKEGGPARQFSPAEDRFLICMTTAVGYGEWERIRAEMRRCWEFRFDYFLMSRGPVDIGRRVEQLIKLLERCVCVCMHVYVFCNRGCMCRAEPPPL